MLEQIVIVGIFIVSLILILKNFEYSVYILLTLSVFLHKELFSFYKWDLLPIRAFMLAILIGGIISIFTKFIFKGRFRDLLSKLKSPFVLLLILLWFIRGISIIFSRNYQSSLFIFGFFTTVVSMGLYLYFTFRENPEKLIKYIRYYIYTVFALTLFGYFQLGLYYKTEKIIGALWNVPGNIPRIGSTFWDVNHYGSLLAMLLPVLGAFILTDKTWKRRIIDTVMFLSMVVGLLLTNSRTAWITAFVSFLVFISVVLFRKIRFKGVLYVLLALFLVSLPLAREYSIKSSPFRARVKQYFHYRMDSFDSHFLLLTGAYQIFENYPVLGGGYGSFFEHFSRTKIAPVYFGRDPAAFNTRVPAHTIWGELIAETGALGLMSYISLLGFVLLTLLYTSLKNADKKIFIISSTMFAAICGVLTAGIFYSYNSEFFWLIIFIYFIWANSVLQKEVSYNELIKFFFGSPKAPIIVLSVISALLIFVGLGVNHFVPWDEAIYAKIAKNMVVKNNFVDMSWKSGAIWYEKPPLYIWFVSGLMKLLGTNEWAARLPSAIFGFLSVLLVYLLGKKWFNKTTGFISGFMLLTSVQFLYYSRAAMLDITASFFILLSIYLYSFAKDRGKNKYWILSGVSVGLAVMVKGVVGFLPFPIIILFEIYSYVTKAQKFNKQKLAKYFLMIISSMLVFLPWHIFMYQKYGIEFLQKYLGYHVWDRATMAIEDKGRPFFWYAEVLKVSMRLWFVVFLASVPFVFWKILKKDSRYVILFIWATFVFFFFSIAKSKLVWYITPIYPALSLLAGNFVERVVLFFQEKVFKNSVFYIKFLLVSLFTVSGLFYLFLNRALIFTSDTTGSSARLLQTKDRELGTESILYVDRIELPIILFYSDSRFEVVDFHPDYLDRVPLVDPSQRLILLTKKGRYKDEVSGKNYPPKIVAEDGDYILWYFESENEHNAKTQLQMQNDIISDQNSDL